ncbi:MAG: hypothetical protein ACRYGP_30610 [Janthinobacterium lividum]
MLKTSLFTLVTAATILVSVLAAPSYAASAHNSQAGANGPSNVNAPIRITNTAHG